MYCRYFIEVKEPKFSVYHEPHCIFENANLANERADVLVSPVIKQVVPLYTLVSGQEDAVKVAEWLKPKYAHFDLLPINISKLAIDGLCGSIHSVYMDGQIFFLAIHGLCYSIHSQFI